MIPIDVRSALTPQQAISQDLQAILPRLAAKDPSLWGPDAMAEAALRLGWISSPTDAAELLVKITELTNWVRYQGLDHVVLCGMGGSSLAPEVICKTYDKPITILDSTDPQQVARTINDQLANTVVIIASKSGSTTETDSAKLAYEAAFVEAGMLPTDHLIIITDPGSPLAASAKEAGYRILAADPAVGGRYSALTAFGLLPSALAGVDIGQLVSDAVAALTAVAADPSPAVLLGALLGEHEKQSPYVSVSAPNGLGDWIEQLVAESTGKENRGLLPIVVESSSSAGFQGDGLLSIAINQVESADLSVTGSLGGQFVLWEWATALAGRVIGINPFDQPNVAESKENTARVLAQPDGLGVAPDQTVGAVEIYGGRSLGSLSDSLADFFSEIPEHGYLAVMAYLDRFADAAAAGLRTQIASLLGCPVTFGWGPRFLHSTGQFHKGNPKLGAFLQITGASPNDYPIPSRPYSFATLQMAQAIGDAEALHGRKSPLLRLHLRDRRVGLQEIAEAIRELTLRRATS